jgi:hypothetical protein
MLSEQWLRFLTQGCPDVPPYARIPNEKRGTMYEVPNTTPEPVIEVPERLINVLLQRIEQLSATVKALRGKQTAVANG